jgi:hypothetical protein
MYKKHVLRYTRHFPDEHMRFILFEAFVTDPEGTAAEVCQWLGLESCLDIDGLEARMNPAIVPRSLRLQLAHNRLFRKLAAQRYVGSHLPNMPSGKSNVVIRAISYAFRKMNLTGARRYPAMNTETKSFLQRLFAKENRGLSELIGIDVGQYWPYMKE